MCLYYNLLRDDAGRKLQLERRSWGMSRRRLGYLTHIDPETIEYIERGYVCMMDFDMLVRLSRALDISPFDFFRRTLTTEELVEIF